MKVGSGMYTQKQYVSAAPGHHLSLEVIPIK